VSWELFTHPVFLCFLVFFWYTQALVLVDESVILVDEVEGAPKSPALPTRSRARTASTSRRQTPEVAERSGRRSRRSRSRAVMDPMSVEVSLASSDSSGSDSDSDADLHLGRTSGRKASSETIPSLSALHAPSASIWRRVLGNPAPEFFELRAELARLRSELKQGRPTAASIFEDHLANILSMVEDIDTSHSCSLARKI
jgi:hypothetical protein